MPRWWDWLTGKKKKETDVPIVDYPPKVPPPDPVVVLPPDPTQLSDLTFTGTSSLGGLKSAGTGALSGNAVSMTGHSVLGGLKSLGSQAGTGPAAVGYNPATDFLLKQDTMQYTVESSGYVGPANNWHKLQSPTSAPNITPYSVALDPAASSNPTYPIGVKRNIYSMQPAITAGTWNCASDAEIGIEGGMFGGTQMGDDAIGGQGGYEFWWSYRRKWPVGFRFSYNDPTTLTPNCTRMVNYKEWLVFREAFGGAGGRWTFSANVHRNGAELNGLVNVDWPDSPAQLWCVDFNPTSTSQKPSPGASARYGTTMNNQLHGVNKQPTALADGLEHEFVFHIRNESVEDAGDGLVEIWVDNYQIYDVDGLDPTNAAYQKAYTRKKAWKTVQWGSIINGGAIRDQTDWLLGPVRAWTR